MKKNLVSVLLASLIVLGSLVSAASEFFEDFEDDTVGAAPTNDDYTFSGGGAVTASGYSGNGFSGQGLECCGSNRAIFDYTSDFSLCTNGNEFQFDVWYSGAFGVGARNHLFSTQVVSNLAQGSFANFGNGLGLYFDGGGTVDVGIVSGSIVASASTDMEPGKWFRVRIYDVACGSNPDASFDVTKLETLVSATYVLSAGSGTLNTDAGFISGEAYDSGNDWPEIRFDNIVANAQVLFDPGTVPGVTATVTKTGGVSASGKLDISWLTSTLDVDEDFTYRVYLNGSFAEADTVSDGDGVGVRNHVIYYSGASSFGDRVVTIRAVDFGVEGLDSCSVTIDLDVLGSTDSCGLVVPPPGALPAEFDTGLEATIESFGFISEESKVLFSMFFVGVVTVGVGISSKYISPGRFKNYVVLGSGAVVGSFTVLLGFLELWEYLVSFVLGVFAVNGAKEVRNTYFEIQEAMNRRKSPENALEDGGEAFQELQEVEQFQEAPDDLFGDDEEPLEGDA